MPVHHLDHINLRASGSAFTALREFYCQVLGLRVGQRPALGSDGLWLYAGGSAIVHLIEAAEEDGAPAAAADAVLDHVAFHCSGLEETLGRLKTLGMREVVRRRSVTGQVLLRLRDPSGLGVELVFAASEETAPPARRRGW